MAKIKSLYGHIDDALFSRLRHIRLLVCDVDGVFSDGRIYLGNQGEELKAFHTRDGYGVKALINAGIEVAVITGRRSHIVQNRMSALTVKHIIQGEEQKDKALVRLITELGLSTKQVAAVGDDVPDLGMFAHAGLRIAVADAHPQVTHQADWITKNRGGFGAVREICDTLLMHHGGTDAILGASV